MSKKILMTGGLGFIGTHCILKWKSLGWKITVVDNLSTNAIFPDDPILQDVEFVHSNILDTNIVDLGSFDLILHLASPVGPVGVLKHSGNMARIILDDVYWAIDIAKYNKAPLIFVSTSEVYGHRDHKTYLAEDDDKVLRGEFTVRNEYSISKLLSEIAIKNTSRVDKEFQYQIIRPFNVTGRYQLEDGGFVLPRFVIQALHNKDITVYYSGQQIRAFTWVDDIVEGIYLVSNTDKWNQEWNIGNESNEQTILYLAQKVKELSQSHSKIVHVDPKELHGDLFSEAPEKIPNSEKIKKVLGWKPTKFVDDVIQEVIDFYRETL